MPMVSPHFEAFVVVDDAGARIAHAAVPAREQGPTLRELRLSADLLTAVISGGRIDRRTDPTRVATQWRAWLEVAGVLTPDDDDILDGVVTDLALRRPRYADWREDAIVVAPSSAPDDLRVAAIEGVLVGDDPAVRVARLLSHRTGDARYWTPSSSR